jgi:superfamily II DNA or RNA helicase
VRWRTRHRAKILDTYQGQVELRDITQQLELAAGAYQNRTDTFRIEADKSDLETLFSVPDSYETRVNVFHAPTGITSVNFVAPLAQIRLFDDEALVIRVISLDDFPVVLQRFSFQRKREEPRRSLFPPGTRGLRVGVPIVPGPSRPPSIETANLEERLRWILTPPIHELLSDPQLCLPERPYPFQTFGIKWLYDRSNALLADEMGLGKTMQAIIAARLLWRDGLINQVLVICPKTLISTWQNEIKKWWPTVTDHVAICGSDRLYFLRLATRSVIIKIINYESLAREDHNDVKHEAFGHDLVIIDEAQRIKNEGKTHSVVAALPACRRWALTGTPLENKPSDVVNIFRFVCPGLLRSEDGPYVSNTIRPYMLRRRADEVLPDLPEKSEQDVPVELDDVHRRTYEQAENDGVVELNSKGDTITVTHVFQLITKLRQICNFDPVSGRSAKLDLLLEELEEIRDNDRKALVFSQFVHEGYGLKKLAREVCAHGFKALEFHGEVPQRHREAIKNTFSTDPTVSIMLLNFMVGGLGLNLQAANYVFLFDRWWNPAVEDQAVKRVHRIGQTQKVFIRKFYCKGTIEERILQTLAKKRRLFRNIIDEARPEPDSLGLTEEEIFSLFNLSVRPKKKAPTAPPKPTVNLDGMDPYQFEELVARMYEGQGYAVRLTGGSHDAGIDIFAERSTGGAVERVFIQCKHQQGNVGRPVVQQLWGVVNSDQSCTRGDLVTSSGFTTDATAFADGKRLTLIDRALLRQLAEQFGVADFGADQDKPETQS